MILYFGLKYLDTAPVPENISQNILSVWPAVFSRRRAASVFVPERGAGFQTAQNRTLNCFALPWQPTTFFFILKANLSSPIFPRPAVLHFCCDCFVRFLPALAQSAFWEPALPAAFCRRHRPETLAGRCSQSCRNGTSA